jgi:DNA polymerase alpha subunit B
VASGPFTTSNNLNFDPLQEIVAQIRIRKPNMVLLLGPFLDSRHPNLIAGAVHESLPTIVQKQLSLVSSVTNEVQGELMILPSIYDATHPYLCFPQPPLKCSHLLSSVSNPIQFLWNDIIIGATSRDVLFDIASSECCTAARVQNSELSDRVVRAAHHVLEQRTYVEVSRFTNL